MKIGVIIKEQRTNRNMTQEELANEFFVSRQLVSKWENGRSYPDLEQLIKLSDFFELSLDELMRGDQKMTKKLSFEIKRKKIMSGAIILLAAIIIFISYGAWSQELISYNKKDIVVEDIKVMDVQEKTVINENGEEVQLPTDVNYKIQLRSTKNLSKIRNAYLFDSVSDSENLYVVIQGQNALFSGNDNTTTLNVLSTSAVDGTVIGNQTIVTVKNKNIRVIKDLNNMDNLKENSWLLVDKNNLR